jgi:hypothetical protein
MENAEKNRIMKWEKKIGKKITPPLPFFQKE